MSILNTECQFARFLFSLLTEISPLYDGARILYRYLLELLDVYYPFRYRYRYNSDYHGVSSRVGSLLCIYL